ncbi:lipid-binding serum glycoprotein family protein [Euphorbia peplus]|nr:lipid-binding serum glycoprotein family protein [Euphorbia peplus]
MSQYFLFLFLFLASSLFIPSRTQSLQPADNEEAFISIRLSQNGLYFLKSSLTSKVLESITPLTFPKIEKTAHVPILGDVDLLLSRTRITMIQDYSCGCNKCGNSTGLKLIAWGEVCNLTINFHLPFYHRLADNGCAGIKVVGLQLDNRLDLENYDGILKLSLVDLDFDYNDISVEVNEEGSWLFRRMIHSFQRDIGISVQNAISKKFREQILKLNSFLKDVPKEIPIDEISSLNVTLLGSNSYIFDINGLLISRNRLRVPPTNFRNTQPSVFSTKEPKSLGILIHEDVLNSASALYYDAEFMRWIVDELPDDARLNTDTVPQLQKLYPDHDVKLNVSLSSPPIIRISEQKIDATVNAELIINVLKADQIVPIAGFSLKIESSSSVKMMEENDEYPGIVKVGANMKFNAVGVSLKWSKIGNLPLHLIQPVMWTIIQTVFIPYANAHLGQRFPLPIIHVFTLMNVETIFSASKIAVCGDVEFTDP